MSTTRVGAPPSRGCSAGLRKAGAGAELSVAADVALPASKVADSDITNRFLVDWHLEGRVLAARRLTSGTGSCCQQSQAPAPTLVPHADGLSLPLRTSAEDRLGCQAQQTVMRNIGNSNRSGSTTLI